MSAAGLARRIDSELVPVHLDEPPWLVLRVDTASVSPTELLVDDGGADLLARLVSFARDHFGIDPAGRSADHLRSAVTPVFSTGSVFDGRRHLEVADGHARTWR